MSDLPKYDGAGTNSRKGYSLCQAAKCPLAPSQQRYIQQTKCPLTGRAQRERGGKSGRENRNEKEQRDEEHKKREQKMENYYHCIGEKTTRNLLPYSCILCVFNGYALGLILTVPSDNEFFVCAIRQSSMRYMMKQGTHLV